MINIIKYKIINIIGFKQFNIFMTHLSNYGNDRLGIYTFDRAIKFVKCWTNLKLSHVDPSVMADMYFEQYPEEKDPIWLVGSQFLIINQ